MTGGGALIGSGVFVTTGCGRFCGIGLGLGGTTFGLTGSGGFGGSGGGGGAGFGGASSITNSLGLTIFSNEMPGNSNAASACSAIERAKAQASALSRFIESLEKVAKVKKMKNGWLN